MPGTHHCTRLKSYVACITTHYPKLDPAPLQDIYAAITAWYEDHNASRIPPQPVLFATLERAMMTLQAVQHDLQSRLIFEDGRNLIRRVLLAKDAPRLSDDELARLRAHLKAPVRVPWLQRDPAEPTRRRKLQETLNYNDALRRTGVRN